MRTAALATLIATGLLAGCTTVQVSQVDTRQHAIDRVCIERNTKVAVNDFLPVLEQGFMRHGIATEVHDAPLPERCEYTLYYTAERGWDVTPYLDFAVLRLSRKGTTIGTANYRHSGGFGLNKWAGTASKMDPVIDQLLTGKAPD
ncbi:MAG TPA: Sbal_3080 family lipoprotein [Arenimonas sp.]|uniref:Sbal_3080 family lipoprotein n=1 Tax=Arenimonas sp. TaxID=1872635 RepID=UPI002D800A1A|nr:Sbal_3080 family lipoprotein [Arenimonas sp.]HEU0152504.1 Sbal_3080 family lipoprotein [Arenimonas sp.]